MTKIIASGVAIISDIVKRIDVGELVILPTDTLYALVADATSNIAVTEVFKLKNRQQIKALPVLMDSLERVEEFCYLNKIARNLAERFWPGALTLVLKKKANLASNISISDKIAVRIPASPLIAAVIRAFGKPITGTSANISGCSDITSSYKLVREFHGKVSMIVEGEVSSGALPSTIIDASEEGIEILRQGALYL
jgi:L-threonylcarbamoyladenylate synthase